MQRDLSTTDLRTTSVSERISRLARDAANRGQAGNQYFVVVETPISKIGTEGLAAESIPDSIRAALARGDGLWSTPTLIRFTDARPDEPGLVVATSLAATRDREVVLMPTVSKRLTISSAGVQADYLEFVTRDAALMLLNLLRLVTLGRSYAGLEKSVAP